MGVRAAANPVASSWHSPWRKAAICLRRLRPDAPFTPPTRQAARPPPISHTHDLLVDSRGSRSRNLPRFRAVAEVLTPLGSRGARPPARFQDAERAHASAPEPGASLLPLGGGARPEKAAWGPHRLWPAQIPLRSSVRVSVRSRCIRAKGPEAGHRQPADAGRGCHNLDITGPGPTTTVRLTHPFSTWRELLIDCRFMIRWH